MAFVSVTKGKHQWPESIEFDHRGNLYFTDHGQKTLFRIKRNPDGTLADVSERLLYGFKHVGGISIDHEKHLLYLGVRVNGAGKVLCIPLELFDEHVDIHYASFQGDRLSNHPRRPQELDLKHGRAKATSPKPNGVVFDPHTGSIFYTHSNLEWTLFGVKGFLGNTGDLVFKEFPSPNGIDIDRTGQTVLVTSLFWKNRVTRLDWRNGTQITSPAFGMGLDGLLCLENGDLLVASYGSGKIFRLAWDGEQYRNPTVIQGRLWFPTDVAIGPSSNGRGESLFVTTTRGLLLFWTGGGKIIEIPNIRELLR